MNLAAPKLKYWPFLFAALVHVALLWCPGPAFADDLLVSDVQFSGVSLFDDRRLRRIAAVRPGDAAIDATIENAVERLTRAYAREGHPFARIDAKVERTDQPNRAIIVVSVAEGPLVRIRDIAIQGVLPEDVAFLKEQLARRAIGAGASAQNRRRLRLEVLSALRKEGYLQASVEIADFAFYPGDLGVVLEVRVETHEPIILRFEGATTFSSEDLLAPLKLDTRTVPFSTSALKRLVEEIVALYQAHGYYFASATFEEGGQEKDRQVYRILIAEGPKVSLKKIVFTGNSSISDAELLTVMRTEPRGNWFTRGFSPGYLEDRVIAADLSRVSELYREAGFAAAEVKRNVFPAGPKQLYLEISIEEGPRAQVQEVQTVWPDGQPEDITSDEVDATIASLRSQPAEPRRMEEARSNLERLLRDRGYDAAQVQGEFLDDGGRLVFQIAIGQRIRVGEVRIEGLVFTREHVVRDAIGLSAGAIIRTSELRRAERNLYRLGLFHKVSVSLKESTTNVEQRDVLIRLFERDTGTLDAGVTFDSEEGLQILGELGQRNLAGSGNSLIFNINGSQRSGTNILDAGTARALFVMPSVDGPDFLTEAFAQYSIQLFNPYRFDKEGLSLSVRTPQDRSLRGVFRWSPYNERVYEVAPDVILGPNDIGTSFYSFLRAEAEWDKRNDLANPTRGFRLRAETRASSKLWAGEVDLLGARLTEAVFLPLNSRLVWANRFTQSAVRGFGSTDVVPITQRIFLGGRNSLRGFSRFAVGPRGFDNNVLGGDTSVEYSTELQYLITDAVQGVVFIDSGVSVLKQQGDFEGDPLTISLDDMRYSPGIGARYRTPIGPIRLEIGFALNREFGERPLRVLLAVGNPF